MIKHKRISVSLKPEEHLQMTLVSKKQKKVLSKLIVERFFNDNLNFKDDLIKFLYLAIDKEVRLNVLLNSDTKIVSYLFGLNILDKKELDFLELVQELKNIQSLKIQDKLTFKKEQEVRKKIYSYYLS